MFEFDWFRSFLYVHHVHFKFVFSLHYSMSMSLFYPSHVVNSTEKKWETFHAKFYGNFSFFLGRQYDMFVWHIFLPMCMQKKITPIMHVNMTKSFVYYASSLHASLASDHILIQTHSHTLKHVEYEVETETYIAKHKHLLVLIYLSTSVWGSEETTTTKNWFNAEYKN